MRRAQSFALVAAVVVSFVASSPSRAATVAGTWPVGAQPLGLAVDSVTGKVYVANSHSTAGGPLFGGGGLVSAVDPRTGTVGEVVTTLPANFVAVDPVGRRLYSSNADFAGTGVSVDAFDLDSGAALGSLPVGGLGLADDHTVDRAAGRLYVCTGSSLKVIDTATFSVLASLSAPSDGGWFDVVVDPERHRIYVSNIRESAPTFLVLDDRDLTTPVAEIPLATPTRFAVAVDPATHLVYAAGAAFTGSGFVTTLSVIDPDSLSVVRQSSLPGFVLGVALAPSRHRIYLSDNDARRIYGLDDGTLEVAETIPLTVPPGLLAMHPDGRLLFDRYDTRSTANSELVALDPVNHPPVFQSLALSPSAPRTSDTLQADAAASDPDLSTNPFGFTPVTLTYEWLRNGVVIAGAAGSSLDLSVAGNGDRGDTISVRVTASDGELSTVATTSVVVADSAPTAAVSLANTMPTTTAVVDARATASDPDNDAISYRFVWKVNGVVRKTTSGPSASDSFDLGAPGNGDRGDGVVVEVVASDGTLESTTASASGTVANSAPTVAITLNTTTPSSSSVLVATVIGEDADRDALSYVYTWSLNGVVKRTVTTTATTDRYDLKVRRNGDEGDVVTVAVTATDGSLTSPTASLSATIRSH